MKEKRRKNEKKAACCELPVRGCDERITQIGPSAAPKKKESKYEKESAWMRWANSSIGPSTAPPKNKRNK